MSAKVCVCCVRWEGVCGHCMNENACHYAIYLLYVYLQVQTLRERLLGMGRTHWIWSMKLSLYGNLTYSIQLLTQTLLNILQHSLPLFCTFMIRRKLHHGLGKGLQVKLLFVIVHRFRYPVMRNLVPPPRSWKRAESFQARSIYHVAMLNILLSLLMLYASGDFFCKTF